MSLGLPGSETRLVLFAPDDQRDRIGTLSNVAFWSDDVGATHDLLVGRGVVFEQPPMEQDWGSAAVFKDPDGNTFVVSSR